MKEVLHPAPFPCGHDDQTAQVIHTLYILHGLENGTLTWIILGEGCQVLRCQM